MPVKEEVREELKRRLERKYDTVLALSRMLNIKLQNVHLKGDKLYIRAAVPNEQVKNEMWNQAKRVDPRVSDLELDLQVDPKTVAAGQPRAATPRTYTVKRGDTLWDIADKYYGDPRLYKKIFEANTDRLRDPDDIDVGQVLIIPQ